MNVPGLQTSAGLPRLQPIQPVLPTLWGAIDTATGYAVNYSFRVQPAAQSSFGGMGGMGALRDRDSQTGERPVSDWPGRDYGIRKPHQDETALSWAEVIHALRVGALKGQA